MVYRYTIPCIMGGTKGDNMPRYCAAIPQDVLDATNYDPETGALTWAIPVWAGGGGHGKAYQKREGSPVMIRGASGSVSAVRVRKKNYPAAQYVWQKVHGSQAREPLVFSNGDCTDLRLANIITLRERTARGKAEKAAKRLLYRVCRNCGERKHAAEFNRMKFTCDACFPEVRKKKNRRALLRQEYNLTPECFDRMLADQEGKCAICSEEFGEATPNVDHCHTTGEVRGLLCTGCNTGLGHMRDDPARLEAGAAYLRRHSTPPRK